MEEIGNSLAMALVLCKSKKRFLPTNISPWRDFSWPATYAGLEGRDSVADGNGADRRNPGKPVKNGLLAIFYLQVFCRKPANLLR